MIVVYLRKYRKMRHLILLFFFSNNLNFSAQELLSSAGENMQFSTGSMTFSIGEIITETGNEGNQFLTQGYCQPPHETVGLNELISLDLLVAPNPFSDFLLLQGHLPFNSFQFSLCSLDGQEVFRSKEITTLPCQLLLPPLAEGSYLLYVHSYNGFQLVVSHLIRISP
jgi:hypothetical protein